MQTLKPLSSTITPRRHKDHWITVSGRPFRVDGDDTDWQGVDIFARELGLHLDGYNQLRRAHNHGLLPTDGHVAHTVAIHHALRAKDGLPEGVAIYAAAKIADIGKALARAENDKHPLSFHYKELREHLRYAGSLPRKQAERDPENGPAPHGLQAVPYDALDMAHMMLAAREFGLAEHHAHCLLIPIGTIPRLRLAARQEAGALAKQILRRLPRVAGNAIPPPPGAGSMILLSGYSLGVPDANEQGEIAQAMPETEAFKGKPSEDMITVARQWKNLINVRQRAEGGDPHALELWAALIRRRKAG